MTAGDRPEAEALHALQRGFAAHIRDPANRPAPDGIEDRRMQVYRDLFFNNLRSMLAGNFPVLRALHDDAGWDALVRDFYAAHRCHTPLFTEIAREFLRYLQDGREPRPQDPPFLLELAHYEWIELALGLDERELDAGDTDPQGDPVAGVPVLSPLAWPLSYRFPVHRIRPDFRPAEAPGEPTHLLAWRDRHDEVRFMELNPVARLLLGYLQESPLSTGRELLGRVAAAIRHPEPRRVLDAGADLLRDFLARDVLLGVREEPS